MQRSTLMGLLAGLAAAVASAQGGTVVTEAEFLSVLDEMHPAVRESAEAVERAEADAVRARTLANPVLRAVREAPGDQFRQTDLLVSWQVPGAERAPRIAASEGAVAAARRQLEADLLRHRLSMKSAYAGWAVAVERWQRLATQAERVEALARREGLRAERGESSGLEARRLRTAAAILRSRVALAGSASERARSGATAWRPSLPADARPVLPDVPSTAPFVGRPRETDPSAGLLVADGDRKHRSGRDARRAQDQGRSSHRQADARVLAARADLAAAELAQAAAGRSLSAPEVSLGWQRQDLGGAGSASGAIFGLAWSLPLLDRRQADRQRTLAAVDAARARLELAEREGAVARLAAERNVTRLSAALSAARSTLVDGRQMLDMAEAAFRLGESGVTDLLETHRSITEAELALLDVHEAALAAGRELERLGGVAAAGVPGR